MANFGVEIESNLILNHLISQLALTLKDSQCIAITPCLLFCTTLDAIIEKLQVEG